MSFEMSLPHAPRTQQVAADGTEHSVQDELQWGLYHRVQQALQQSEVEGEGAADGGQAAEAAAAAAKPPQPSDPQKVLDKLLTARGELDVISDLVGFVEAQQFLAVEMVHRHPLSLQERLTARSLRLAASKQQLRGAAARLVKGLEALQAQARVDDRFLEDLAQLRQRWRLRRHGAGLFYADISLPLRGSLAQCVGQEGAHCNIIQDTNGDACIVEPGAGGRRRAVRGWRHINAVLAQKQQLLSWRVLQQLIESQAGEPRYESDPDGAVAVVQKLVAAAVAACQAAVLRAVPDSSVGAGAGGAQVGAEAAADMEVDGGGDGNGNGPGSGSAGGCSKEGGSRQQQVQQDAAAGVAIAALAPALPANMLSSAAKDIQSALLLPGFQQQFEGQALLLLSRLLPGSGGSSSSGSAAGLEQGQRQQQQQHHGGLLQSLLDWLRHAALCLSVGGCLQHWAAAADAHRSLQRIPTQEEFATVWQLRGPRSGPAPVLVVVQGDRVRVEGVAAAAAQGLQPGGGAALRSLSRSELENLLASL